MNPGIGDYYCMAVGTMLKGNFRMVGLAQPTLNLVHWREFLPLALSMLLSLHLVAIRLCGCWRSSLFIYPSVMG